MQPAYQNMKQTMDQVNRQLNTRGGAHHYYVRALQYFMKPLENSDTDLNNLLAATNFLSSRDFIKAQEQLAELYKRYQERMPWVRDLVWYTDPNMRTSDHYKHWRETDENMRKALKIFFLRVPCSLSRFNSSALPTRGGGKEHQPHKHNSPAAQS